MAEVAAEFAETLSDLTVNSKPHINMLTMLADDNHEYAPHITQTVLSHLQKVPPEMKLPVLYLIDSIIKNVGKSYIPLFTQAIVQQFANTFEQVDEKTREQMFKLRQTWADMFPAKVLYALDSRVKKIDSAWPCTASPPSTVHLNPKFFKPDILGSKSLTATLKDTDSHRSANRKSRTTSRSQTHSSSSRSKKTSQASSTAPESVTKTPSETLREQVIMKQKMLLELQQQKLKLELLQTQAQLEEQQKQLERQSLNHKPSSEPSAKALKLQQMVNEEEAKYKIMSKNLKRHMQMKFPKLHQVHRMTTEMKAQAQKADLTKASAVPEGLLKPAALLELNQGDVHVKPPKSVAVVKPAPSPLVPKEAKPRIVHLQPPMEKQKAVVPAESTEEVPPPVRIAPVSSQLINAALSFGRNVRDPRIRQMSSRLETQLNSAATAPVHHTHPPSTTFTPPSAPATVVPPPSVVRKPETGQDSRFNSKPKKDKRSNSSHHKEKSSKSSEEDSKHSKSPIRSSERTSRRVSGKGDKSLSKKVEDKSDKKSKVDDLFSSRSKSPIHLKPDSSCQSPSKSHSKRDHVSLPSNTVGIPTKTNLIEKTYEEEPSLKKARLHDSQQSLQSPVEGISELKDSAAPVRQMPKLSLDIKAAESTKPDSNRSPESLDSSADMLDEDIEKIVKNTVKINKFAQKVSFQVESPQKSPKSSDNSPEDRFEDIIRNPTKQIKKHEISKSNVISTEISKPLEVQTYNIRPKIEIKTANKSDNSNVLAQNTDIIRKPIVVDVKNKDLQSSDIHSTKKILTAQLNEAQESVQTKQSVQHKIGQSPVQIGRTSSTFTQYKEALDLAKTKQSVPQMVEQSPVQIGRTSGTFTQHKETQESLEIKQTVQQLIEQSPVQFGRTSGTFTQHKEPQESVQTKQSVTQITEQSPVQFDRTSGTFTQRNETQESVQTKQSVPQIFEQTPVQFGRTSSNFTHHIEPHESAETKQPVPQIIDQSPDQFGCTSGTFTQHKEAQESVPQIIEQSPVLTGHTSGTFTIKDPRLYSQIQESKTDPDPNFKPSAHEESKDIEESYKVDNEALCNVIQPEEFSSTINPNFDNHNDINERFFTEEVVTTEVLESIPEDSKTLKLDSEQNSSGFEKLPEIQNPIHVQSQSLASTIQSEIESKEESLFSPNCSEKSKELTLSPRNVPSPVESFNSMEVTKETDENIISAMEISSPTRAEKRRNSPIHERKSRKGEKPSIMEQLIADAEKHEASPSPPPPPIISDKFKEIKQSSLSRLRRVGRLRDDLGDSESPEPADVDLRPQIQPPLIKDLKNEVLGLADKDVDLRNLPASPTKKRPSMEKLLDVPPAKKSKAEVMDELFGSEDVDLRPVLCPPPPSPPPPPIISSSPPQESASEKGWARYKENKPDTYKAKYTPSRRDRDRAPSIDRFSTRNSRNSTDGGWQGRTRTSSYQKDVDMRAQPLGVTDGSYNHIIMQAYEQLQRGDLNAEAYKRVLSEVCAMREKHQLEEAQRRDEEAAQAEPLEPISDEDISGGSLSGVEDAPSPTDSYTGGEDVEESSLNNPEADNSVQSNQEKGHPTLETHGDIDIRLPPTDIDIRMGIPPLMEMDDNQLPVLLGDKSRRKNIDGSHYNRHSYREEMRAQKREKRARRSEERGLPYRSSRYAEDSWGSQERRSSPSEARIDVEPPRVPPIPNYREHLLPPRDSPPLHPPGPWETQRMTAPPPTPWLPGMAPPVIRGPPPVMSMPPPVQQERFIPPRWRQPRPGPIFEGEPPAPRFRFGPLLGRPPVPFALEVPPTDPNVLKLIEEDPTKTISIDGVPRDIRFYGPKAVALMNWDDPREVTFQNASRRIIVDDRDSLVIHFNNPPQDMIIDGQTHRVRFGAPTRELYIDNQWYEVFFGGPPVTCEIGGKPHKVQLEGPPPNVRPGIQRKDLVVGKISLIIDAEYVFCIYLDAKPQKFEVDGVAYIIRFVEALQKTVINGVPFQSDFGGLPQPIILNGTKHFFRLTALPRGVTPGFITIVNMEGGRMPSPPSLPAPPQLPASLEQVVEFSAEPPIGDPFLPLPTIPHITQPPRLSPEVLNREIEAVPPSLPPTNVPPPITSLPATAPVLPPPVPAHNTLDMLTTLMPTPEPGRAVDYSYSVDSESSNHAAALTTTSVSSMTTTAPTLSGDINVTELLQKLMATGIVPKLEQPKDKDQDKPVVADTGLIRPVDFLKPETLKIRQTSLVAHLYSGIQCNSCGVRFPPEQTMKYSQHLDWHFRQNRRDKDSTRTAQTRRYYYDVNDWVQFEEIEDLEERAQPWFDMQESDQAGAAEEAAPAVLVSVRAADYHEDAACHICQDKFESFYNEEKEEWQLRNAVDTDGKLAHPLCIEDQRAAAEKPIVLDDIDITEDELKEEVKGKKEEEGEQKVDEDDDIMEVTDIEFIKPVFPVEDLTVSDSESVADNNEDKPEILEEDMKEETEKLTPNLDTEEAENKVETDETKEEEKGEEAKVEEDTVQEEGEKAIEDLSKDENTQDDVLVLDKGEDSVLSTTEIMEVVRNIKKDPDALGGEYEEVQDPDVKKEKGEVPLPAPVVDTTHTTVNCLIDGNVEFEETPQQLNVGGPPRIKINITKPNIQPASKEPKESIVEDSIPENAILAEKLCFVNQPPPPGEEPLPVFVKEKLIGRKMQELPCVVKGSELSGLCSVM